MPQFRARVLPAKEPASKDNLTGTSLWVSAAGHAFASSKQGQLSQHLLSLISVIEAVSCRMTKKEDLFSA
jgi:hypothetical protein